MVSIVTALSGLNTAFIHSSWLNIFSCFIFQNIVYLQVRLWWRCHFYHNIIINTWNNRLNKHSFHRVSFNPFCVLTLCLQEPLTKVPFHIHKIVLTRNFTNFTPGLLLHVHKINNMHFISLLNTKIQSTKSLKNINMIRHHDYISALKHTYPHNVHWFDVNVLTAQPRPITNEDFQAMIPAHFLGGPRATSTEPPSSGVRVTVERAGAAAMLPPPPASLGRVTETITKSTFTETTVTRVTDNNLVAPLIAEVSPSLVRPSVCTYGFWLTPHRASTCTSFNIISGKITYKIRAVTTRIFINMYLKRPLIIGLKNFNYYIQLILKFNRPHRIFAVISSGRYRHVSG